MSVFPDNLMLAGLKYYFLKAKKLDFGAELAEFNTILSMRKAQDIPVQTQSLVPIMTPELVYAVPDGSWNIS
jgi:hypothetical protein